MDLYRMLHFWLYFVIFMPLGHIQQLWGIKKYFNLDPWALVNPLTAISPENFRAPFFRSTTGMRRGMKLKIGWCRVPSGVYSQEKFQLDWTPRSVSDSHGKVQMVKNQQNGPDGRGATSMNLKL